MINELSSKIHFTARSHETMYLGSYHFLLKKFQEVEKTSASAVKPLWKISKHSQFDKFIEEFNWLNRKVNEYSHAPNSGKRDRLDQDISEVFELLTKGVFLAVLNDTA
mgnify:CR=1 FL=1